MTASLCSPIWSAQSAKDVPDYTAKAWAGFRPTAIGAGTIYHHAMANGWSPDPELTLNGNVRMNGRHPARALLEKLSSPAAQPPQQIAEVRPAEMRPVRSISPASTAC